MENIVVKAAQLAILRARLWDEMQRADKAHADAENAATLAHEAHRVAVDARRRASVYKADALRDWVKVHNDLQDLARKPEALYA